MHWIKLKIKSKILILPIFQTISDSVLLVLLKRNTFRGDLATVLNYLHFISISLQQWHIPTTSTQITEVAIVYY